MEWIFDIADSLRTSPKVQGESTQCDTVCDNCNRKGTYDYINGEYTCTECGLVGCKEYSDVSFDTPMRFKTVIGTGTGTVTKYANWYAYSSDEKCAYKLGLYITELCARLNLPDSVVDTIKDTVGIVLPQVNALCGTKRAKVKDAFIAVCIIRVVSDYQLRLTPGEIMKALGVNVRYVSKAENVLIELYNRGKLQRDFVTGQFRDAYECVMYVTKRHGLYMDASVCEHCKTYIQTGHKEQSPLVQGAIALYKAYSILGYRVDTDAFSKIFKVSVKTLDTFSKIASPKTE